MADTSLFYYQDQFLKVIPRCLRLEYKITASKTASPIVSNSASYVFFDALSTQAQVDDFLGTEDEFLYTAFGSTAMGADCFAGLVNMGGPEGQAALVTEVVAKCYSATDGATLVQFQSQALAVSDTAKCAVQVGAYGNIAFQVAFGNSPDFDGLTSGTIVIEIYWISK